LFKRLTNQTKAASLRIGSCCSRGRIGLLVVLVDTRWRHCRDLSLYILLQMRLIFLVIQACLYAVTGCRAFAWTSVWIWSPSCFAF